MKKITVPYITALKHKQKIVMLTAYSARMAELMDNYVDIILVGDSLGMTLHGMDNTLGVTMDMMICAGQSVNRGRKNALLVVDMPFSTYESCPHKAYDNAAYIMQKTGCEAIKIEGGMNMSDTISFLTQRNIPVMGHVGLLPQSVHHYGGYGVRGRDDAAKEILLKDIKSVADAGAFSIVIEGTDADLSAEMTESVTVPTIGIGASQSCDGQVLVSDDMLGITHRTAKFVKHYDDLQNNIKNAFALYADDVRNGRFPDENYIYRQSTK